MTETFGRANHTHPGFRVLPKPKPLDRLASGTAVGHLSSRSKHQGASQVRFNKIVQGGLWFHMVVWSRQNNNGTYRRQSYVTEKRSKQTTTSRNPN